MTKTEEFIEKARKVHGDKYDYSRTDYVNNATKVCIICPEHGEFWQTPHDHTQGAGCPMCNKSNKLTTETFIIRAKEKHGGKYDYSKVGYINSITKIEVICPIHGSFKIAPSEHLQGQGCPICSHGFSIEKKISLLQSKDLVHLSAHQLIEIIGAKKLPSEFKCLIYTSDNSDARMSTIQRLKKLFDNNANSEEIECGALDLAKEKKKDATSIKLETMETNNDNTSLLSTISEIHIHDNFIHTNPSDDSAKFLVLEEIHKLWNEVLDLSEDERLDEAIETITNEDGGEFWKHIRNIFLKEFDEVNSIKQSSDYKFPYEPSLMQKLMVYHLMHNKSFGNWCGTGAGKTNAFLFATRKTDSRVTVAIVPNDTIDTLVNAINKIYPDSNVVIPKSCDDLYKCDRSKFNYIIYNYEKFQGNNGAEDTINKLLETNIDFICLDEVQNVKVRDNSSASSRSKFVNELLKRGRNANPEMKTLAMSATPCINNLAEVRSIIELLTEKNMKKLAKRTLSKTFTTHTRLFVEWF